MDGPVPLVYTFCNHMHWVDMEWLWGYHVMPGSVRDMIKFCRETGAKGGVNFDGIGYEKLAVEAPNALDQLREAVREGWIEPVGCSYGQPYGQFHGGESNVRQRVYGVRTVMRLLATRPRIFCEEEFDFFPQLPQMLSQCGFTGASLFFQWTWHTPEVPTEDVPVIQWEGHDGTRLPSTTRSRLNLHQWPEDFESLLNELAQGRVPMAQRDDSVNPEYQAPPLIQQWLELMPSKDWMCRSELMIPKLKELKQDTRFEVQFSTLGEYLELAASGDVPVRKYHQDEVWHGLTLGKNADDMRHRSARAERELLNAEGLSCLASLFGRPYAQWDVYPTWELEEAWRELLAAQHHDNCECEGLCGRFGKLQYDRALSIARETFGRTLSGLGFGFGEGSQQFAYNPYGWSALDADGKRSVPPYSFVSSSSAARRVGHELDETARRIRPSSMETEIGFAIDLSQGGVERLSRLGGPDLVLAGGQVGALSIAGEKLEPESVRVTAEGMCAKATYGLNLEERWSVRFSRAHPHAGVDLIFDDIDGLCSMIEPGFKGALMAHFPSPFRDLQIYTDSPYAVHQVGCGSSGHRKYPEGDWMTSPQWFEEVEGAFTSLSFVDLCDAQSGEGLLIAHTGFQQWFLESGGTKCVLAANDPWDEGYFQKRPRPSPGEVNDAWTINGGFRLIPHAALSNSERWKIGQEFRRGHDFEGIYGTEPRVPPGFAFLHSSPANVVVTALYREEEGFAGTNLSRYAGEGMEHPFVLRMVEFDGLASEVQLSIAGPVARAYKTNLMGEVEGELTIEDGKLEHHAKNPADLVSLGIAPSLLSFKMRPFEIATLYLDIVPGRKQTRDLDAKREVWAQVHRSVEMVQPER